MYWNEDKRKLYEGGFMINSNMDVLKQETKTKISNSNKD